jgi:hypothetical protein
MEEVKNTAEDYEDLVGYVSEDNLESTLAEFIGETYEYKPSVKLKEVDPLFPEEWQVLYVNFPELENYKDFMKLLGEVPTMKLKEYLYRKVKKNEDLSQFFGD